MNLLFLVALALAPGITISFYIYFRDKYEPEPVGLLIISFFYGLLAVCLAFGLSFTINHIITIEEKSLSGEAIHAFIIVALVEELSKFAFVRGILYRNKNFNEPFDGIVYSVMVGMGFATFENLLYVIQGGQSVAIVRIFSAVPAHALFAVLMGFVLGIGKFRKKNKLLYSAVALLIATFFHGIYDYFLFITFIPGIWVLAFVSLAVAFILSKKAIDLHQDASPFK